MKAADPDIDDTESLNFAFSEPITAVNKNGKPVTDNNVYKVRIFVKFTCIKFIHL